MINPQTTPNQVDQLKKDYKIRLDTLEAQLKNARWEPEKERIKEKIDQLKRIYEPAIRNAEIDQILAETELKKQADAQEERKAARKAEIKNHALQEFIRAGGDPNQFEAAWPMIEQSVLNEKVINALLREQTPTPSIKL